MRQTFYINPDEEIISVIGKIKNSPSMENILVIPPGSLVLQSIINLKLLKKESEKLGKQIMIVVQDKQSRQLIEKAGILAQSSLEGLGKSESNQNMIAESVNRSSEGNFNKKERLRNIGSKDFFNGQRTSGDRISKAQKEIKLSKDAEVNKKVNISDILNVKRSAPARTREKTVFSNFPRQEEKSKSENNFNSRREKEIKKLFGAGIGSDQQDEKMENNLDGLVSEKVKKVTIIFLAACFFLASGLAFYMIFPKAKVNVLLNMDIMGNDITVKGSEGISSVNLEKGFIPAAVIKKESSLSLSFNATGKSAASNKKARGVISIYNEYGKSPQALVATTRFLTSDGKLFRLIRGVIVPGMTEVDGKMEPGVIEAEVIADEPGEEYNIGPSDFSIPGFKGSPKYGKFYARSFQSMAGGGSAESRITIVSQEDIDLAKSKTESALEDKIKEEIKKEAGEDKIILDGAIDKNILESKPSLEAETASENFDYQAKMEVTAIIFSQEDLLKIAKKVFEKKLEEKGIKMEISRVEIEYGRPDVDFKSGEIIIKTTCKAMLKPEINLNNLKKELLGKDDAQIKKILKKYPQIDKVEIEYWPEFLSRKIPRFENRVKIETIFK